MFRLVGWPLIMDHNVAAERCSGFIMLAALANLPKVVILQLPLNAAESSGSLASPLASADALPPAKVVEQTESRRCVPNPFKVKTASISDRNIHSRRIWTFPLKATCEEDGIPKTGARAREI